MQTAAFAPRPARGRVTPMEAWEEYPPFDDARVEPLVSAYQARLREVEGVIETRNATRPLAYPWQMPSRISRSIHV